MVFPFELYCRVCGSMILRIQSSGSATDMLKAFEEEESVESWISNRLLGRPFRCPNCRRKISADPLVRGEVVFGEWGDESGEKASPVIFYV
jgi:hypothetical protein